MNLRSDEFDEILTAEPAKPKIQKKTIVIAVIVLAILFVIGYYMFSCMLGYTAKSRYDTLRVEAKNIYLTAEMWVEEGNTLTTHRARLDRQEDVFSEYLHQYVEKKNGWYVIVCDAQGNPDYVLFSREKISDKRMHVPDKDEEMKRLRSPIWHTYAIGCYQEYEP